MNQHDAPAFNYDQPLGTPDFALDQPNESHLSPSMDSLEINVSASDYIDDATLVDQAVASLSQEETEQAVASITMGQADMDFSADDLMQDPPLLTDQVPGGARLHEYRHSSLADKTGSIVSMYTEPFAGHSGLLGLYRLPAGNIPDILNRNRLSIKQVAIARYKKYLERINCQVEHGLHPDNYGISFTVRGSDGNLGASAGCALPVDILNYPHAVKPVNLTMSYGKYAGQEIWGYYIDARITLLPAHMRRNLAKKNKAPLAAEDGADLRSTLDSRAASQPTPADAKAEPAPLVATQASGATTTTTTTSNSASRMSTGPQIQPRSPATKAAEKVGYHQGQNRPPGVPPPFTQPPPEEVVSTTVTGHRADSLDTSRPPPAAPPSARTVRFYADVEEEDDQHADRRRRGQHQEGDDRDRRSQRPNNDLRTHLDSRPDSSRGGKNVYRRGSDKRFSDTPYSRDRASSSGPRRRERSPTPPADRPDPRRDDRRHQHQAPRDQRDERPHHNGKGDRRYRN